MGDLINKRKLEIQLKEAKEENIQFYIDSLEYLAFNPKEHAVLECPICSKRFAENEPIKRIPTCGHYFHSECIDKHFWSKIDETEQKCPQCEMVLNTKDMQALKPIVQQQQQSQLFMMPIL